MFQKHFTKRPLIHPSESQKHTQVCLAYFIVWVAIKARGLNHNVYFILMNQVMFKSRNFEPTNQLVSTLTSKGMVSSWADESFGFH